MPTHYSIPDTNRILNPIWVFFSIVISGLFITSISYAQAPENPREYIEWYQKKFGGLRPGPLPEMAAVTTAETRGDYQEVLRTTNRLIEKPDDAFESQPYASWLKSVALLARGQAKQKIESKELSGFDDFRKASELGNIRALNFVVQVLRRNAFAGSASDKSELARYLRIGAELGSGASANELGSSSWANPLDELEKRYWGLAAASSRSNPAQTIEEYIRQVDKDALERAMKQYSLFGDDPVLPLPGLPQRNLVTRAFLDILTRREYGQSYGRRPSGIPATETPSTLELFNFTRAAMQIAGVAQAYLLVPSGPTSTDSGMRVVPRERIMQLLSPSDQVVVRCGPLSHTAMVYRVDRKAGLVYFADGLYQYWQPTHNSCTKEAGLRSHVHGGFLVQVPGGELMPMLQAVITYRDR